MKSNNKNMNPSKGIDTIDGKIMMSEIYGGQGDELEFDIGDDSDDGCGVKIYILKDCKRRRFADCKRYCPATK